MGVEKGKTAYKSYFHNYQYLYKLIDPWFMSFLASKAVMTSFEPFQNGISYPRLYK